MTRVGEKIPYTDDGLAMISDALLALERRLTPEQREARADRIAAMVSDDWDAFAAVAIREVRPEDLDPRKHAGFVAEYRGRKS